MTPELKRDLLAALERPHRLGTIGGNLEEQLAHCASFSSVLRQVCATNVPALAIDLGTGGGLPGVALAGMWPQVEWVLVDVRAARADEVERTLLRLGYDDRTSVLAAEAQLLGHDPNHRERYDIAVARAFGPASVTAECATGVLAVGGFFVVSEPPTAKDNRWPSRGLETLGFAQPKFFEESTGRFAVMEKLTPASSQFPRLPARSNRGWPAAA